MEETFDKILSLYVPDYKNNLTPFSIQSLKELFYKINSPIDYEQKKKYRASWDNAIYNIQKYYEFYEYEEDTKDKVIIKVK